MLRGGAQVWGFVSDVCTVGMRVKTGGEEEHDDPDTCSGSEDTTAWIPSPASNVGRISVGDILRGDDTIFSSVGVWTPGLC